MPGEQGVLFPDQGRARRLAGAQLGDFKLQGNESGEQASDAAPLDPDVPRRAVIAADVAPCLSFAQQGN